MSIAVLGGSFNPIHLGHLAMAEAVLKKLNPEKVLFVPSGNPPHKSNKTLMDYDFRRKLIEVSIKDERRFELSDADKVKDDYSYTLNLVRRLKNKFEDDLFFIIGADNVTQLKYWYKYRELLDEVKIVVLSRSVESNEDWKYLDYLDRLIFVEMPFVNVSSTEIRERLKNGKDVTGLVPKSIIPELKKIPPPWLIEG